VLGLAYMVSPRTVKSFFFIGQGSCCHYSASGLDTVNLVPQFEQFQKCSVDARLDATDEISKKNLANAKIEAEKIGGSKPN
jgi:hypothetical protein